MALDVPIFNEGGISAGGFRLTTVEAFRARAAVQLCFMCLL